jgi:hypothetical protein
MGHVERYIPPSRTEDRQGTRGYEQRDEERLPPPGVYEDRVPPPRVYEDRIPPPRVYEERMAGSRAYEDKVPAARGMAADREEDRISAPRVRASAEDLWERGKDVEEIAVSYSFHT